MITVSHNVEAEHWVVSCCNCARALAIRSSSAPDMSALNQGGTEIGSTTWNKRSAALKSLASAKAQSIARLAASLKSVAARINCGDEAEGASN